MTMQVIKESGSVAIPLHFGGSGSGNAGSYGADAVYDLTNQRVYLSRSYSQGSSFLDTTSTTKIFIRYR